MDFSFNINNLFGGVISVVDSNLVPYRKTPDNYRQYRDEITVVIDKMGEASARAQGLPLSITTWKRLQMSDHHLYIIKEADANRGLGAVIGVLKVGRKKLFVYDHNGLQHELDPLCVLDFYVHESRQRQGCGRKLFDYMLATEQINPAHMAIDRPSHKFSSFLLKHYGLKAVITQVNNFVIFEGFFTNRPDSNKLNKRGVGSRAPTYPCANSSSTGWSSNSSNRQTSGRGSRNNINNTSTQTNANQNNQKSVLSELNLPPTSRHQEKNSRLTDTSKGNDSLNRDGSRSGSAGSSGSNGLSAGASMYSRHDIALAVTTAGDIKDNKTNVANSRMNGASTPPLLSRDGPPVNYLGHLPGHPHDYLDRGGHLKVTVPTQSSTDQKPAHQTTTTTHEYRSNNASHWNRPPQAQLPSQQTLGTSWNVFGVPQGYQSPFAYRQKPTNTKLW